MPFPKKPKPEPRKTDEELLEEYRIKHKPKVSQAELIRMKADAAGRQSLAEANNAEERRKAREEYMRKKQALLDAHNRAHAPAGKPFAGEAKLIKPPVAPVSLDSVPLQPSQVQRLRELAAERIRRRREALKVWVPMPMQRGFEMSDAKERVLYGSNRSGKTTCAAVEFARMVLGVHRLSGKRLPLNDGIACVVGYDYSHIGRVIYRKLFKKGAFRVVRDKQTGEYRPYEPDGRDSDIPLRDTEPSPPLIPKRFIAPNGVNWLKKKSSVPASIKLTNGWEIRFFSSEGEPPQGDACHVYWFDEEIEHEDWYLEASRALMAESGYFIWSATPHVGGDDLIDLHTRAEKLANDPNASVREFLLLIFDNMYLANSDKQELVAKWKDKPEAYRTRILGEFAAKAFKVYPEFHMDRHGFNLADLPGHRIPDDWCRYAAIDPGLQVQAVLFLAVPPPHYPGRQRWYVYDELYLDHVSVTEFARAFEIKTRGQNFEALIIDMRAGRITNIGGEKPVEQIYREALSKVKVRRSDEAISELEQKMIEDEKRRAAAVAGIPERARPRRKKRVLSEDVKNYEVVNVWDRVNTHMFIPGADNPKSGVAAVKEALAIDSGTNMSQLAFARGVLPNFEMEMSKYHHKRVKGKITDEFTKKDNHLCDDLRYLVCFRPEWKKPKPPKRPMTGAARRLQQKRARLEGGSSGTVNFGPRSSSSNRRAV